MQYLDNILFWLCILLAILNFLSLRIRILEKKEYEKELDVVRKDSIKRSKSIIRATVNEEILPLFSEFPYQIGDLKLFGKPIDYIVFEGMNEFRDGNKDKEITIVFADVKTGNAVKTPVQKAIMKALENGRIRFEEWRVDENNKLIIK